MRFSSLHIQHIRFSLFPDSSIMLSQGMCSVCVSLIQKLSLLSHQYPSLFCFARKKHHKSQKTIHFYKFWLKKDKEAEKSGILIPLSVHSFIYVSPLLVWFVLYHNRSFDMKLKLCFQAVCHLNMFKRKYLLGQLGYLPFLHFVQSTLLRFSPWKLFWVLWFKIVLYTQK